jgi:hypothetical protein
MTHGRGARTSGAGQERAAGPPKPPEAEYCGEPAGRPATAGVDRPVIGVGVLVVLVVAVAVGAATGAARNGAAARRARRAGTSVQEALAALQGGNPGPLAALAGRVPALPPAEAAALVYACRRAFSRDIVPVLAAALGHADGTVVADASQALGDLGSPGLRAVWRAVETGGGTAAQRAFLCRHPDWLFERLIDTFATGGADAVRRQAALWREAGLQARLESMRRDDAINRQRAEAILGALGAPGSGDRVA